ncbi:MAG: sulfatase-like hydrolase/transferase [Cytophagales bacterium]|nr:sulfatase-like hydrolase/transferase [Cytophagales bacterium]
MDRLEYKLHLKHWNPNTLNLHHFFLPFKRFLLVIVFYTVIRILFYLFNFHVFDNIPVSDLLLSFLHGIRFDLSILIIINAVFIFFSVLPFRFKEHKIYQTILKTLFLALNIPFLILNLIDLEYFKFTGKRVTADIINISNDVVDQLLQLSIHFWYMSLLSIIFAILLFFFYPMPTADCRLPTADCRLAGQASTSQRLVSGLTTVIFYILLISFSFLAVRGGFQLKPLRLNHAFVIPPNILGILTLNTPFTFINTFFYVAGVEKVHYFKNDKDVLEIIKKPCLDEGERDGKPGAGDDNSPSSFVSRSQHLAPGSTDNIIIIILESFSSEYLGTGNSYKGYTPFLDSLAQEGIFFKNNFANGRTSMQAVPAIIAGIPALMDEPLITSIYQTNEIYGLGTILKQYGYQTSFFHGGINGTMGFDMFSKILGMDDYYGMNEYPESENDYNGNWGIFDESFLQFFAKKLSQYNQPFFSVIFTLSSHQPYTIPKKYEGKFPKGVLPIHESIGYTDHALKKFFETVKAKAWYSNTLFIITADHTQKSSEKAYQNVVGQYRVPLILFHPKNKLSTPKQSLGQGAGSREQGKKRPVGMEPRQLAGLPSYSGRSANQIHYTNKWQVGQVMAEMGRITQHVDIMPGVLDYLGFKTDKITWFGNSFFNENCKGYAINYSAETYRLIHKDYYIELTTNGDSRLLHFSVDTVMGSLDIKKKALQKELKAYIQYFNNGLVENSLYRFTP